MKGTQFGVAGVGLIGGSIALRARAAGATVVGFDRDPAALSAARSSGALDDVVPDLAALAERCTIVAIALPVDAVVDALATTPALAKPALVFDVASVKEPVARAGAALRNFVGSHPLAGRETAGFAGADAALFEGRTWAVIPGADAGAQTRLEAIIRAFGARPLTVDAPAHDALVAVSSHLPQTLSVVLGALLAAAGDRDPRVYDLCGPGMESMLRLARSPAGLWAAIAGANAAPLAAELRAMAVALERVAAGLDQGDVAPLIDSFDESRRALAGMERANGPDRSLLDAVPTR